MSSGLAAATVQEKESGPAVWEFSLQRNNIGRERGTAAARLVAGDYSPRIGVLDDIAQVVTADGTGASNAMRSCQSVLPCGC